MELKIKKLEQLVKLKDSKILTLTNKLSQLEGKNITNHWDFYSDIVNVYILNAIIDDRNIG